jgi:hypothetical protein
MDRTNQEAEDCALSLIQSLTSKRIGAIKKYSGERIPKSRLIEAEDNFWTSVRLRMIFHNLDATAAIEETPYRFSKKKKRILLIPDLDGIESKYNQLRPKVQLILNKTKRNPVNRSMSLAECLGVTDEKKITRYISMNASDIALSHLARTYKLQSGDALKKNLAFHRRARREFDILRQLVEAYKK